MSRPEAALNASTVSTGQGARTGDSSMARGITELDAHGAAEALVADGERPTVERVRTHTGTGSRIR